VRRPLAPTVAAPGRIRPGRPATLARLACALAALGAAAPGPAAAHDLWLEPQGQVLVLRHGHRGGELLELQAAKVTALRCRNGAAPASDVRPASAAAPRELRTPSRCDAASALLDNGFWSLTPDGERNLPRSQVPDAVRSWQSRQFAKWVDVRAPGAAVPLGDDLEIVPVTDLSRARQGDKATFRVLWQGKPAAGAVLSVDHRPLGETDAAGEVRVRLRAADVESVSATLKRPLGTPEADTLVAEASLTFEVAR
jgi:nickel transport protein